MFLNSNINLRSKQYHDVQKPIFYDIKNPWQHIILKSPNSSTETGLSSPIKYEILH